MTQLSTADIDAAIDSILRPLGSASISQYMPLHQERARKAMRDLIEKHQQQATVIPITGTIGK